MQLGPSPGVKRQFRPTPARKARGRYLNEGHEAMSRNNRNALADRVVKAVDAALAAQGYVSAIDVLVGIRWLDIGTVERWRRGQIDCRRRAEQTNLPRTAENMKPRAAR